MNYFYNNRYRRSSVRGGGGAARLYVGQLPWQRAYVTPLLLNNRQKQSASSNMRPNLPLVRGLRECRPEHSSLMAASVVQRFQSQT